jgi:hypothetical protein
MITQRAALLGFVAFCFYLIAVVNVLESYYYALTWAAIGIFGASLGLALLSLIGLECKIEVKRSRASATLGNEKGAGPLVSISLKNSGTLNKTGTLVELTLRSRSGSFRCGPGIRTATFSSRTGQVLLGRSLLDWVGRSRFVSH